MDLEQGTVDTPDLTFGYLACGSGPLALCLHGFPDSAHGWRHLLPRLANAGFRAVAPFMRGYAPTAVPAEPWYQSGALSGDANALHEALGGDADAVIVGHDWGAMATYGAAVAAPERWRRVVAMAVPPAPAMMAGMLSYAQQKRSWYMWFFQTPMADIVVPAADLLFIDALWSDWSPGFDASTETPAVKDALRSPANLQAALGYYRALFDPTKQSDRYADLQAATAGQPVQPTLYLHGADDGCIGAEVAGGSQAFLSAGSRAEVIDGCGHFLHLERPDEVNGRILDFLAS